MNKKKNKGERSAEMQEVSAGLQDVLGMTQWRAAHAQATLREIEAAVDAQMNQLRAQLIQELVQMGEEGRESGAKGHQRTVPEVSDAEPYWWPAGSRRAPCKPPAEKH